MKTIIGIAMIIGGIIGGLYVGGWLMLVQPIIEACRAFDAGALTGTIIGMTVLKCLFASGIGSLIVYVGIAIGTGIMSLE